MSIFSKLFKLFLTVVLLPLIPMALLLAFYQTRQETSILENYANLAEIISLELNQYADELNHRLSFSSSLSQNIQAGKDPAELLQHALQSDAKIAWVELTDSQGNILAQAAQPGAKDIAELSRRQLVFPMMKEDVLHAGIVRVGDVVMVEFMYPLAQGYALYGKYNMEDFIDRLQQMRIGHTGQVYLMSPDGILYRGPYQWLVSVRAADLRKAVKGPSRLLSGLKTREGKVMGAVSSTPRLGVYVTVLQPKEEALRSLYFSTAIILLFILAIMTLAYFGALIFSRSLGEPIAELIRASQEVSRGNLDYQIPLESNWREFTELIHSFNRMIADLKDYQALQLKTQISDMKEQVFRAVAHDLRAPLLGLQGYIYLLSSGQVSEAEQKEYIARMTEATQNLSSLLEDVLAVSRVETGMALPQRQQLEAAPLVQNILHTQQPAAQAKQLILSADIPQDMIVWADPKLLKRILMNLLSNAVKFTEKGTVQVRAWQTAQSTYIAVQDTGIGMTAQQTSHLFEQFSQVNAQAEGFGLGLFISRQLARAHGGDLTVDSTAGKGSTFTLYLPKEKKQ